MNARFLSRFLAAAGAALACAAAASAQTILDDFSTDKFATSYVQKTIPGFGAGGWNVTGGTLQPDSVSAPVNGYAAFVWTANSLQHVGDWFSIDLYVQPAGSDHNAGFSVWTSTSATFDRVVEPRLSFDNTAGNYDFIGAEAEPAQRWDTTFNGGAIPAFVTLKITLSGQTATDSTLDISLSGAVNDSHAYTAFGNTGPFFVGPSAWQASGGNIQFDNLTYFSAAAAIPEPSTYAAIFGAAALGLAAWRRRQRRAVRRSE